MERDKVLPFAHNKDDASYQIQPVVGTDVTVVKTKHYSFLGMATFVTLCCCCTLPFGIIGIIYSVDSSSRFDRGDFPGALSAASKAKKWLIAGVLIGSVIVGLYIYWAISSVQSLLRVYSDS